MTISVALRFVLVALLAIVQANYATAGKGRKGKITVDQTYHYAGAPLPGGYPNELQLLTNIGYEVGYDNTRKNAAWVAYRLFKVTDPERHKRPSYFRIDKRTSAYVRTDDYKYSGYNRGHMAPNYGIDTRYGQDAQKETFVMSNVVSRVQQ